MFELKINFLSLLEDIIGFDSVNILLDENSTVKDMLEKLTQKFGMKFQRNILNSTNELNKYIILGINGKDIRSLDNLKTIIVENDDISFLPAIAGG